MSHTLPMLRPPSNTLVLLSTVYFLIFMQKCPRKTTFCIFISYSHTFSSGHLFRTVLYVSWRNILGHPKSIKSCTPIFTCRNWNTPTKAAQNYGTCWLFKPRYVNLVLTLLLFTHVLGYWFSHETSFPTWVFWFFTPGIVICVVYLMGVQQIQGGP